VTLNISPVPHAEAPALTSEPAPTLVSDTPGANLASPTGRNREQLTDDLLDAMTAWNPSDRLSAFRTWQRRALSLIHLQVITILELQGPLPMNRLAELTGVSVASATGIVARMEGRHLVERRHDPTDRRLVVVALTSTGKRMFRVIEQRRRAHLRKVLGHLSEDELTAFLIGLRAVKAAGAAMAAAAQAAAAQAAAAQAAAAQAAQSAQSTHGARSAPTGQPDEATA
jgi:DNA-binding MarR family transcriptional regulator